MPSTTHFHPGDLEHLCSLGISADDVERQLSLLRDAPIRPRLDRPCRVGDGIKKIRAEDEARLLQLSKSAARSGRLQKFVPASGAATRMFSSLEEFRDRIESPSLDRVTTLAREGNPNAEALLQFLDNLDNFPFHPTLNASVEKHGSRVEELRDSDRYVELLDHLLAPSKLAYPSKAKGLLEFHRYPAAQARTAFEEQLIEGLGYCTDSQGIFNSHFTVAPDQLESFTDLSSEVSQAISKIYGARPVVTFSTQSPASDTIAIDRAGELFRTASGNLLLRPAGHGALIENLQQLDGDIVLIKNIDNIAPENRHSRAAHWKKLLVGHLLKLQEKIFEHLQALHETECSSATSTGVTVASGAGDRIEAVGAIEPAIAFLQKELALVLPPEIIGWKAAAQRQFLVDRLDRPLRVCGMVKNEGEPGGGPFWVRENDGALSGQIIEAAQVDRSEASTAEIWENSTHFNPVDLVCSLRDADGQAYDLQKFIDSTTAMVVDKEVDGRKLKALERPGLWNGAMADWNTAFVEVPAETFTPVKTIFDLLRPEHQPQ